jgi:hypothetical protein
MLIAIVPVLVCILGLLIWALNTPPPRAVLVKVGEWMFVVGLLVTLLVFATHVVRL